MHYPLPAQDASDVKGKNNQQEAILKALKDCQKVRPDNAQPYAPAYVLQKVWATGLDSISTKGLKEAFAKDLGLNLFSDAETSKLRTTIVQGLTTGQWDLRVSERVYIKTDAAPLVPSDIIEFSDRMVLYRRGILEPPKPREIEINAQVMPSTQQSKPVRVRWKAAGALSVKLFQDGVLVAGNFLPSDEYEGDITQSTVFRIVADYGEEETAAAEYKARVQTYPTSSGGSAAVRDTPELFDVKPEFIDFAGSLNSVFNDLRDRVHDDKINAIARLEITVSQVIDYRKLTTALPLLMRYPIGIDQFVTIQTGDQFVRPEYQSNVKGFQGFANPTNTLLATAEVRAEVSLKITFEFAAPIDPQVWK